MDKTKGQHKRKVSGAPGKSAHPPELLEAYDALIAAIPNLERKGVTMPYTAVNGHMFSFINKAGNMGLRLEEKDREAFIKKHNTSLCLEHGAVMKEYVSVPAKLLARHKELMPYFKKSFNYVSALKPKTIKKH